MTGWLPEGTPMPLESRRCTMVILAAKITRVPQ